MLSAKKSKLFGQSYEKYQPILYKKLINNEITSDEYRKRMIKLACWDNESEKKVGD